MTVPSYLVGLDLGQARDFTALCVVKRTPDELGGPPQLDVVHLERFPRYTPYPAIVAATAALVARPELRPRVEIPPLEWESAYRMLRAPKPKLCLDATGVGRACVDMFLDTKLDAEPVPITITGGLESRREPWRSRGNRQATGFHVAKRDLVGVVQAGLMSGKLKIVASLAEAETLRRELLEFKSKITPSANEVFGCWREGVHDDLVLACAMAAFVANQRENKAVWGPDPFAGVRF